MVAAIRKPKQPDEAKTTSVPPSSEVVTITAWPQAERAQVQRGDQILDAQLAPHITQVVPGQRVLLVRPEGFAPLIIAAYPLSQPEHADTSTDANAPLPASPFDFDPRTGTLTIRATQLKLEALGVVELHCGDAILRLNAQGELFSHAQSIVQSAIGSHRIEGGSIDMN